MTTNSLRGGTSSSGGGLDVNMAPWVASQGYNVLSLAYFRAPGLPNDLLEQPLEYFARAAHLGE